MENWISNNLLLITFSNNKIKLVKYFGRNRSFAIESKGISFTDEKSKKKAISEAKKQIAEERKYINPMHGMTYYC